MLDLLIRDARVLDGSGNPWFRADVGVSDGRIAAIGRLASGPYQLSARRVIGAAGRVLCPGFIDTHVHSELAFLTDPTLEPKVRQGITTEVLGQDGLSVAPVSDATRPQFRQRLAGLLGRDADWTWSSVAEYLERVEAARPSVNACYLAPHGTIRAVVMGFDQRPATAEELEAMQAEVARAMAEGAVGLSSGLIYPPCAFGDAGELEALCRVAGERGGVFVVHVRNEGDGIVEAIDEVVGLTRRAGIPLHVSHLKVAGARNKSKLDAVLERFGTARAGGHDVTFDQYPYFAGSTVLDSLLPPWVLDGGVPRMLERLRDPGMRRRIAAELERPAEWENFVHTCGWQAVVISSVRSEANRAVVGKNLVEIARLRGVSPADACFDILLEEGAGVSMVLFWGDEDVVRRAMAHPLQMVGSDGVFGIQPHPRVYGAFPRVLGPYVRDGVLPLEEAVRKMTSHPAQRFGLAGRGLVKAGFWADLVLFDPDRVTDRATYEDPHQFPEGIDLVVVNGEVVVEDGRHTGARPGRVLRGNGRGQTE